MVLVNMMAFKKESQANKRELRGDVRELEEKKKLFHQESRRRKPVSEQPSLS